MWATIGGLIGIIVVAFGGLALTGGLKEIVVLARRGAFFSSSASMGLVLTDVIIPFFLLLLVFGIGAALMRVKFQTATVWKTIAGFVAVFGVLGIIMGIT